MIVKLLLQWVEVENFVYVNWNRDFGIDVMFFVVEIVCIFFGWKFYKNFIFYCIWNVSKQLKYYGI